MKIDGNEVEFDMFEQRVRIWVNTGSGYVTVCIDRQDVQNLLDSFEEGKDITQ